ncbi:hypothetical protein CLOHYLEM_04379 [[Clostridium] hylemonae DSM 15053]|uniref:Uncharacterized protein n=1 Tax=[Clostridium] hylemonae DSM 15053 TaxID=553973 RepID=C0BX45_9FIRM|nr:hypothetical protein CLOHYLEM_04379 [[Clostridium] hylemonae DSM 15053]
MLIKQAYYGGSNNIIIKPGVGTLRPESMNNGNGGIYYAAEK